MLRILKSPCHGSHQNVSERVYASRISQLTAPSLSILSVLKTSAVHRMSVQNSTNFATNSLPYMYGSSAVLCVQWPSDRKLVLKDVREME